MTNTLYLFTDVETTGLNFENSTGKPIKNPMLQIAYQLWNSDLSQNITDANYIVKYDNIDDVLSNMDDYVTNMHTSTGLVDKLKDDNQTTDLNTIDDTMFSILKPYADQNYRIMLVGNNIQFDFEVMRRHLPKTVSLLHYAFLDVSSIRRVTVKWGLIMSFLTYILNNEDIYVFFFCVLYTQNTIWGCSLCSHPNVYPPDTPPYYP